MFSFIWTALIGLQIFTEFSKRQQTCQSMTKNCYWGSDTYHKYVITSHYNFPYYHQIFSSTKIFIEIKENEGNT